MVKMSCFHGSLPKRKIQDTGPFEKEKKKMNAF
jgi:hypothetical protein